jgi:archaellum component FlaC
MEDALKKLDKLTQEEARMAIAENLKATHSVDDRVRGVANTVVAIDNRVAGVDDRLACVDVRVAGVDDRVADVDVRVAGVDDRVAGVDVRVAGVDDRIKQTANDVDQVKRPSSNFIGTEHERLHIISENQLRENVHKWLSPPDPSTNHNIACGTHHKKTATWFFQGTFFRDWKSSGSLLWIHGKRAPSPISHWISFIDMLICSWLRQEHSLVGGCLALSIIRD